MENWLKVKNHPNYEVSDNGRVRNAISGRVLRPRNAGKGYQKVTLCDHQGHHEKYIHRLVTEAFYDGPQDGFEINHIDGNKKNNHISNLERCSRLENVRHAINTGLVNPYDGGVPKVKVRIIETGEVFESIRACARAIDADREHIGDCLHGRARSHKGLHFEYAE